MDAPEFISYREWESEAAIEAYRNSEAHKEIVQHARALKRAKRAVRCGRVEALTIIWLPIAARRISD
jgi:heme-degrading monooxygenase HmoA